MPLNPEFVSITDGEGGSRPAEVEHEDGVFSMTSRDDGFVHGEQTYVFTYTLENVTRAFDDAGSTSSSGMSPGPSGRSRSAG